MTDLTPRLRLPLLQPGQAQKEMTHNEALVLLDILALPVVEAAGARTPPPAPQPGQAWALGPAPGGDWADHAGALAGWTSGGWRFADPAEGQAVWSRADGCCARYLSGIWAIGEARVRRLLVDGVPVVGAQGAAVADPAGGGVVDAEARAALAGVLAALRTHGLIAAG